MASIIGKTRGVGVIFHVSGCLCKFLGGSNYAVKQSFTKVLYPSLAKCCWFSCSYTHTNCNGKWQLSNFAVINMKEILFREKWILPQYRYSCNSSAATRECWKCNRRICKEKEMFFCAPCNVIQAPDSGATYFDIMGIKPSFEVDLGSMTKRRNALQTAMHPDKYAIKSDTEKRFAELQSTLVNRAYRKLSRPVSRAQYLLKMFGHPLTEGEIQMSPAFLMAIMDLNEQLMDKSISLEIIEGIGKENDRKLTELYTALSNAFKAADYKLAKQILSKLKYYVNIEDKVKTLIQEKKGFI